MASSRRTLTAVPLLAVPLCALLLSGCGFLEPTTTAPPSDPLSPSSSSSPAPDATPTPTSPATTPVDLSCDQLVSAQQMYDFNPNFTPQPDYTPATGSLGAQALALDGIACGWVNQSSGHLIEMSVARPSEAELAQRRTDLFTTSNSVPTYEVEGFFVNAVGVGTAEVFDGPYWVAASSPEFFEPGDVDTLMQAALGALG